MPKSDLGPLVATAQQYAQLDLYRKVTIQKPAEGSDVCGPMDTLVTWFPAIATGTFTATLDNVDVMGHFDVDEKRMVASASLAATEYDSSLAVSVEWPSYWNPGTFVSGSDVRKFHVPLLPAPRLNATPIPVLGTLGEAVLDIVQGMQNVVAVSLVTNGRCHPDMEIVALVGASGRNPLMGPPYLAGVTFNTPFVISAGSDRGLLYITSARTVPAGTYRGMVASSRVGSGSAQMQWFDLAVRPPV
jgi:hypothetical protein